MKTRLIAAPAAGGLLLAAAWFAAAGGGDDLKRMQGTWAVRISETDGQPASEEDQKLKLTIHIEGDAFKVYHDGTTLLSAGTLKLDASRTPRTIDTTLTGGPFKGTIQRGIYEFKDGEMIANFAKPGKERPAEFKTRAGSGESILRYTRVKQ